MAQRLLVATRKGLFILNRSAAGRWEITQHEFPGEPVSFVLSDPRNGNIHAALDLGHFGVKMRRSVDSGATFEEVAVPEFPPKPEGESDIHPMTQKEREWSLSKIWALTAGGSDQPGRLWAGSIPGAVFKSDDHGDSWEICRTLWDNPRRKKWFGGGEDDSAVHSILVDPRNSKRVLVAISCGGIWVTEDDGTTWDSCAKGMIAKYMPPDQQGDEDAQDPHAMGWCLADPDRMYVQHHGGLFQSVNGSKLWTEIKADAPSRFGFPVAVHPTNPDRAWFVPAASDMSRFAAEKRVVVTRTDDGGKTLRVQSSGLPQENAFDLVYRHALALGNDGETLAFGSTTGNFWVSENGGDDWTTISHHLPPVYCVTFEHP